MHIDQKDGKDILVCTVGKTVLHYNIDCLADLHKMLKDHGDWIDLGSADEQKPAKEGTVEAWGVQKIILLAVGTDLKKDYVDASVCIYHH